MSKINRILCCIFSMVILACTATGVITVSAASKNTVTTSISKVESKAKGFKVTWKKKSKINGYQIQYSTSSKFKKSETKTKTVSKAKTTSATVSKLKGCNKKYYVRVRTYKIVNDKKIYSSWSKAKSVTTLKHKYSSATCTKAKICKYCNKTSGEKLGHSYNKGICTYCGVKDKNYVENYFNFVLIDETMSINYSYDKTHLIPGTYAVISLRGDDYPSVLKIPAEYNGKPVTAICSGLLDRTSVETIVLPATIKIVGNNLCGMHGCITLKKIVCLGEEPFALESLALNRAQLNGACKIYVPDSKVDAYKNYKYGSLTLSYYSDLIVPMSSLDKATKKAIS